MANTVRNTSRPGIFHKLSTARSWVEQCVCAWVIEGRSIRELSLTERLDRMRHNLEVCGNVIDGRPMSKREGYLPPINVAGEKEVMPRSEVWTAEMKYQCLVGARNFCQSYESCAATVNQ